MTRPLAIGLTAALVLAACSSEAEPTPTPAPSPVAAAEPSAPAEGPAVIPILVSSEFSPGANRFLFSLTDRANQLIAAPDVSVDLLFYDSDADPDAVAFEADGRFLWALEDVRGLYVAEVDFPSGGRWATRFNVTFPDGRTETVRADYDVLEESWTPAIGAAAPSVDTPTLDDVGGELARVSTDPEPNPRFYGTSVEDALAAGEPFVLVFATPAFCESATCGPTLELVKGVAADYPDMTFINVEPYVMEFKDGGLTPVLSEQGQLQPAEWTNTWKLLTEPFIFMVDAAGTVRAKYEGAFDPAELREAIDAVTAETAAGIVIAIDTEGLGQVRSFTLRSEEGEELVLMIDGPVDLGGGGFPPDHLREHMALAEGIVVVYELRDGDRVVRKLSDAPWLDP